MDKNQLINHKVISDRYFFPRKEWFENPFFVTTPEGKLGCHFTNNHPDGLTLVHFHGNGEIVCDWMGGFVSMLDRLGCNILLAEYKGYGMSDGTPSFGAILEDTPRIIETARLDPSRTVLFGRSIGSIPAIRGVSLYPGMAGLVFESGVADVLERLIVRLDPSEIGTDQEELKKAILEEMDHKTAMNAYTGPVLVMHARNDSMVNISHGQRLYDWAGGDKKEIRIFERGDHNNILSANVDEYFSALTAFLKNLS